jgi:hypothetical protein
VMFDDRGAKLQRRERQVGQAALALLSEASTSHSRQYDTKHTTPSR